MLAPKSAQKCQTGRPNCQSRVRILSAWNSMNHSSANHSELEAKASSMGSEPGVPLSGATAAGPQTTLGRAFQRGKK